MALFKLSRRLCDHMTSIVWWGSKNGERKSAWVSWDEMTMPKYKRVWDSEISRSPSLVNFE